MAITSIQVVSQGAAQSTGRAQSVGPTGGRGPAGERGPAGDRGNDGAAGRGVAAMVVDGNSNRLMVTFTDGVTQDIGVFSGAIVPNLTDGTF